MQGVGRAPANLKIIAGMYSTPGLFVVRADNPYRTISDLRGSGLMILARYVLEWNRVEHRQGL